MPAAKQYSSWGAFLRLWVVMLFSYLTIKFLFNLFVLGWIDLRRAAFQELLFLPLGQSVVFWMVTRRSRKPVPAACE
jgi:hypothetical protein